MITNEAFNTLAYLTHMNDAFSNAKLCEWSEETFQTYKKLLNVVEQSNGSRSTATTQQKGQALEQLASFVLENCGQIFQVSRNIRNTTNEIDNLMTLTKAGNCLCENGLIPKYYRNFIGECKNYEGKVGVTYIGKFCSLMLSTTCHLGIFFSYHGVTGTKWRDASGLIKKFYLHKEDLAQRYSIIDFNITDFRAIAKEQKNFLQIVEDKAQALQFDTDYLHYLSLHPAQSDLQTINQVLI